METLGRVLVVVPTYNERDNLPSIVERIRSAVPHAHVLVADDNSPDGTGEVADGLAAADEQVHVLHRPGKQGLGAAYIAGFRWGLDQGYEVLVEMDADGSHQPEELPRLLDALGEGADLAIGSRYVPGGRIVNWPQRRELLSKGANVYTRVMLGLPVRDATAGFRAYRAAALEKVGLSGVESQGYCFQVDLTLRTVRAGLRVAEVPSFEAERVYGSGRLRTIPDGWRVLKALVGEALDHRARRKRLLDPAPRPGAVVQEPV